MGKGLVCLSDDAAIHVALRQAQATLAPRDQQALASHEVSVIDARLGEAAFEDAVAGGSTLAVIGGGDDAQAFLQHPKVAHVLPARGALLPRALALLARVEAAEVFDGDALAACLTAGTTLARMSVWPRDKLACIDACVRDLQILGTKRRPLGDAQSALDELLMNALIDAPAVAGPLAPGRAATAAWGYDAEYIGIAVRDDYGLLSKAQFVGSIVAARSRGGAPIERANATQGAGIGLYLVASRVSHFVVLIAPGHFTEVVCLFHRHAQEVDRSLHVAPQVAAEMR
ncbi:MAG: hypothetical protein IPL79_10520 [Myxococcales bacterium]|nr:hypothetical protein [Myxococcales bacterium]